MPSTGRQLINMFVIHYQTYQPCIFLIFSCYKTKGNNGRGNFCFIVSLFLFFWTRFVRNFSDPNGVNLVNDCNQQKINECGVGRRWHLQYLGLGKDKEKWDKTCLPSQQLQPNNDILFSSLLTGVKCNYQSVRSDWVSASHRDSNIVKLKLLGLGKEKEKKIPGNEKVLLERMSLPPPSATPAAEISCLSHLMDYSSSSPPFIEICCC